MGVNQDSLFLLPRLATVFFVASSGLSPALSEASEACPSDPIVIPAPALLPDVGGALESLPVAGLGNGVLGLMLIFGALAFSFAALATASRWKRSWPRSLFLCTTLFLVSLGWIQQQYVDVLHEYELAKSVDDYARVASKAQRFSQIEDTFREWIPQVGTPFTSLRAQSQQTSLLLPIDLRDSELGLSLVMQPSSRRHPHHRDAVVLFLIREFALSGKYEASARLISELETWGDAQGALLLQRLDAHRALAAIESSNLATAWQLYQKLMGDPLARYLAAPVGLALFRLDVADLAEREDARTGQWVDMFFRASVMIDQLTGRQSPTLAALKCDAAMVSAVAGARLIDESQVEPAINILAAAERFSNAERHLQLSGYAFELRALAHQNQGNLDGAIGDYREAIQRRPSDAVLGCVASDVLSHRAVVAANAGDFQGAYEDLSEARRLCADDHAERAVHTVNLLNSEHHLVGGRFDTAAALLHDVVRDADGDLRERAEIRAAGLSGAKRAMEAANLAEAWIPRVALSDVVGALCESGAKSGPTIRCTSQLLFGSDGEIIGSAKGDFGELAVETGSGEMAIMTRSRHGHYSSVQLFRPSGESLLYRETDGDGLLDAKEWYGRDGRLLDYKRFSGTYAYTIPSAIINPNYRYDLMTPPDVYLEFWHKAHDSERYKLVGRTRAGLNSYVAGDGGRRVFVVERKIGDCIRVVAIDEDDFDDDDVVASANSCNGIQKHRSVELADRRGYGRFEVMAEASDLPPGVFSRGSDYVPLPNVFLAPSRQSSGPDSEMIRAALAAERRAELRGEILGFAIAEIAVELFARRAHWTAKLGLGIIGQEFASDIMTGR